MITTKICRESLIALSSDMMKWNN